MVPKIQTIRNKSPRRRPAVNETSRIEAKEGGREEVNLPPGSEGYEDQIGSEGGRMIGRKRRALHADEVGRRI